MAVKGQPRRFHKKFAFTIEIEGVESANFTKSSALEAEIAKVLQWEGGKLIPDKSPGRVTVSDVTLERGVAQGDSDLYNWWLDVVKMSANTGKVDGEFQREVEIIQKDRDGVVLKRWILDNCWPTKMVVGEWDNDADENVIEMVTLTLDTFDKIEGG